MNNCPHICIQHRFVARHDKWATRRCPVDGAPLLRLSPRMRVPKKGDDAGWAELKARYQAGERRRVIEDYAQHTGQRAWEIQFRMRRAERLLAKWR